MKQSVIAIFGIFLTTFSSGQTKKIVPQFEFTQIDSLVDNAIAKIIQTHSSTFVVASVKWYVGSYVTPKNRKFASYRNAFEVYLLFSKETKFYIQKIDNFGYFKEQRVDAQAIKDFLTTHFEEMKNEILDRKIDTIYITDSSLMTSQAIGPDHQLLMKIKILMENKELGYDYPSDYSNHKSNLVTYKYKFLKLIDEQEKQFERRKPHRIAIIYGNESKY